MSICTKFCILWLVAFTGLFAQPFSSGSNGSDGALNITTSGDFDPVALGLDTNGDNIFHFTTINIPAGVTVRLKASKMRRPSAVYWLATGNVTIAGTLNLSGAQGHDATQTASQRTPSEPGPGGYPGGAGMKPGGAPQPGFGPGGGSQPADANGSGCSAGHATPAGNARCAGAGAYGNPLLVPLVGGSGGSGRFGPGTFTPGGSAGGGAIRISSNTQVEVTGSILANGAPYLVQVLDCYFVGGSGSGGAIHLQAPVVRLMNGSLVQGVGGICTTNGVGPTASDGRIRIDSSNYTNSGTVVPLPSVGPLVNAPLPTVFPTVTVTSVNGVAVPANPQGLVTIPDVNIDSTNPITVGIAATQIPVGTQLRLFIMADSDGIDGNVQTTPLAGTLASSTATATVTLPRGVPRIFVRAIW